VGLGGTLQVLPTPKSVKPLFIYEAGGGVKRKIATLHLSRRLAATQEVEDVVHQL
jgi:hypothetical protein